MDKEELLDLVTIIESLGLLFVTVADKDAAVTLAETREKLHKLYEHWYALL